MAGRCHPLGEPPTARNRKSGLKAKLRWPRNRSEPQLGWNLRILYSLGPRSHHVINCARAFHSCSACHGSFEAISSTAKCRSAQTDPVPSPRLIVEFLNLGRSRFLITEDLQFRVGQAAFAAPPVATHTAGVTKTKRARASQRLVILVRCRINRAIAQRARIVSFPLHQLLLGQTEIPLRCVLYSLGRRRRGKPIPQLQRWRVAARRRWRIRGRGCRLVWSGGHRSHWPGCARCRRPCRSHLRRCRAGHSSGGARS